MSLTHDVFLACDESDAAVARDLAARLRKRGLRVWREDGPGEDHILEGLESSRTLVLCLSANVFSASWSRLEGLTFRFRDPTSPNRVFIPLQLDDFEPPEHLGLGMSAQWRVRNDDELDRLVLACSQKSRHEMSGTHADEAELVSFGHSGAVNAVAITAGGERAVTGSRDGTIRAWDLATGRCEQVIDGADPIYALAVCADFTRAVTASEQGGVRLWDLTTGACLSRLENHIQAAFTIAVTPDGSRAFVGSNDGRVLVWNLLENIRERTLSARADWVPAVAISQDGSRAISGSPDGTVEVWDLANGHSEHVLPGHTGWVGAVAITPDGALAVSGSADGSVRVWDLITHTRTRVFPGHTDWVGSVAVTPNGAMALSGSGDGTVRLWDLTTNACSRVLIGHTDSVQAVAITADGMRAVSGSGDGTVRVWDLVEGTCVRVLEGDEGLLHAVAVTPDGGHAITGSRDGVVRAWNLTDQTGERMYSFHTHWVRSVAVTPDGVKAVSGSDDGTVRVWDRATRTCTAVLTGHTAPVQSVAISGDGARVVSGSDDSKVRVWDAETGTCERVLYGHQNSVESVAITEEGLRAVSGSADGTVRVWDLMTGNCDWVLEGHSAQVLAVAIANDGLHVTSGSSDKTVRVWDLVGGTCESVLEGHTSAVYAVAFATEGDLVASGSEDGTVRLWQMTTGTSQHPLEGHSGWVSALAMPAAGGTVVSAAANGVLRRWKIDARRTGEEQVRYANAKVVLVGEHQTGKTGLATRLTQGRWEPSSSTVGAWVSQLRLGAVAGDDVEREVWLWDFGGQADQRLVHQIFLSDAAVAVFVYDGDRDDALVRLWDWSRSIRSAAPGASRLLAAGRVDENPVRISGAQLDELCVAEEIAARFETSAKLDKGCNELRDAVLAAISWDRVPQRTSPAVFKSIKDAVLRLKERRLLVSIKELRDVLPAEVGRFDDDQLEAVVGLLAGPGLVRRLDWGGLVLLRPELLNTYAQIVVRSLSEGCVTEERVLRGDLEFPDGFIHPSVEDERTILHAMHHQLVTRKLCLRDEDADEQRPTLLVFPSELRVERPSPSPDIPCFVSFNISGHLPELWASLVVRLHHTAPFRRRELWRYAADFGTPQHSTVGLRLVAAPSGTGQLEVRCETGTPPHEQALFVRYVQKLLHERDPGIRGLRTYWCPECGTSVENRETAHQRLLRGDQDMACPWNERHRIPLKDELAELLAGDELQGAADVLQLASHVSLDSEDKERVLVGEVLAIAAGARQIARELTVSDHGIDMEIEFKTDDGRPTARRVYLQLKSGDSHLRYRRRDDSWVFDINKERHADYWANHDEPVLLVIRNAAGRIALYAMNRGPGPRIAAVF